MFRVYRATKTDPKNYRVFVVVSRQVLIESKFSTVICAPIYSNFSGISTQVQLGIDDGVKNNSCIYCDELISIPKQSLTHFIGSLSPEKINELNQALKIALSVDDLIE